MPVFELNKVMYKLLSINNLIDEQCFLQLPSKETSTVGFAEAKSCLIIQYFTVFIEFKRLPLSFMHYTYTVVYFV